MPFLSRFTTRGLYNPQYIKNSFKLGFRCLGSVKMCLKYQQNNSFSSSQKRDIFSAADIAAKAPLKSRPFLDIIRFDKPIGTWLLFLPGAWSISMAANPGCWPSFELLGLFGVGAFLMRGAGCIINDMWDQDFDKKVTRTRSRPLAAGTLTNFQALSLLSGHLSLALCILLSFNWYSIFLGASSVGLVVVYPFMKRITYWPQLFLGVTFNWGALLGWSAVHGSLYLPAVLPLYIAGVTWTLIYDTIYAHQDKDDDILIGVKSTALHFGDATKKWLAGFSAIMTSSLVAAGVACDQSLPYFLGVVAVTSHLAWQIKTVDLNNGTDCASKFKSNKYLGLIFLVSITIGNFFRTKKKEENKLD